MYAIRRSHKQGRKINVKLWTGGHLFDSLQ